MKFDNRYRWFTDAELASFAAVRPPGYLEEMMLAATEREGDRVTFDTEHPAYVALVERHKNDPPTPRVTREIDLPPEAVAQLANVVDPKVWGPPKWEALHTFCRTPAARDPDTLIMFVTEWRDGIPYVGCTCRDTADEYLRRTPPNADDPFGWSFEFHNAINIKLRKPVMTRSDADIRWPMPLSDDTTVHVDPPHPSTSTPQSPLPSSGTVA